MRTISIDALGAHLPTGPAGGPRIVVAGNGAVPWQTLKATDAALAEYRLFMLNAPAGVPTRTGVTLETPFVGPGMRRRPNLAYFPARLSLVPSLLAHRLQPDAVLLHVAPPRDGHVSLGIEVNILPAAIEAVRRRGGTVVAQVNPRMPYTQGDAVVPVDDIDIAVEVDEPLNGHVGHAATDTQAAIGEHVASLVGDGATLQLGIGGIPDATLRGLVRRRELRVWSEMISDGVLDLERAGALADDALCTSFASGSDEFYEWLERSRRVRFLRTEKTNDPGTIARQPAMTSINAALQIDLYEQANASYVRGAIHSGFGGQTDFTVGALHSPGGRAIIALPSWHEVTSSSTIVDRLASPATSFQHSCVVTEQGIATIWGRPQPEQARELIDRAADPRARAQLTAAAERLFGST